MTIEPLPTDLVADVAARALAEDRAHDDVSTLAVVPPGLEGAATFRARVSGVLAGSAAAAAAFAAVDPRSTFDAIRHDGEAFAPGDAIAVVHGPVRAILQAERVALNFMQRLSGVATLTARFVAAVEGTGTKILDTRKTTPLLRDLEKYAVRCGGGVNHRRDLAAMAMLKDNHLAALLRAGGTVADAVAAVRRRTPGVAVEVEIDRLDQLESALAARPEWILLDNMSPRELREAVRRVAGAARLEASGGVTLDTVREIAESGVDTISIGALTHSAPALDISLELEFEAEPGLSG